MIEVKYDPARRLLSFDTLLGRDAVRDTRGTTRVLHAGITLLRRSWD